MELPEILLIDKPSGISSYDCIRRLRRKHGKIKMGHAGTLDPLASGLMIIGTGTGTKKLTEYIKLPKTYEAEILLGTKTDTGDMEGRVVEKDTHTLEFTLEKTLEVLDGLCGEIVLPVPKYSAIKQGGVPLYKKVRSGKKIIPTERVMNIKNMKLLELKKENGVNIIGAHMHVGSGTYIRSIAEEIGKRLETIATLKSLRRIQIGDLLVEDALKI
jgi:tRNA pseudouridine55 synthase